jgi:hypothetical protein
LDAIEVKGVAIGPVRRSTGRYLQKQVKGNGYTDLAIMMWTVEPIIIGRELEGAARTLQKQHVIL